MATATASRKPKNPPRAHNTEPSPLTPRDTAAKLRAIQALELRTEGYSYREIGERLGYSSTSAAFYAVERELERTKDEAVENLRRVHNLQLNRSLRLVTQKILAGGSDALWAMDRQIHLLERQAKLNGLDITRDEIMSAMPYQKRIVLDESPLGDHLEALSTPQLSPVRSLPAGPETTYVGDVEQD